jgi:Domain of unknown function (DUF4129)
MSGKSATSWSWLHSVAIPALLVIAEATWVSLLIDAIINTSSGPHPDLPFLAVATPAVAAVTVAGVLRRITGRWWWQVLILIPVVVVGTSLAASTSGLLTSGSGSWWRLATQPWSVSGRTAAAVAGTAWFVAALTWARGTWLGTVPPSFRATVWSLSLGAAAFIGMFLGRADRHAVAFRATTAGAGWLLFLWFPLSATVVALVRERDLERQALSRTSSRPSAQWLTILSLPMLGVALMALGIAVVIGPGAPIVGHAVAAAATAAWEAVAAAARWLWDLIPGWHSRPAPRHTRIQPRPPAGPSAPVRTSHALWTVPAIAGGVVGAVIVVTVIVYLIRNLRPVRLRWKPPDADVEDETRDSVFSWRHLGGQVWGALLAWLGRLRRQHKGGDDDVVPDAVSSEPGPTESVRAAYRRVLRGARASGQARQTNETTRELQNRLTTTLAAEPSEALGALTRLYDAVRYGETDPEESARAAASSDADSVTAAWQPKAP